MESTRKIFIKSGIYAGMGATFMNVSCTTRPQKIESADYSALNAAMERPVLKKALFQFPVIIESCDL